MTAVSDRLDRIEAEWRANDSFVLTEDDRDVRWLLALARGHQATLEQIAALSETLETSVLARERLREAEGDT